MAHLNKRKRQLDNYRTEDPRWISWMNINKKKISDGFEWEFVGEILAEVNLLHPDDLIAQSPFKDRNGKNRRMDFRIFNKQKGYDIGIEVDGTYKDVNHVNWKDFLLRQNSLQDNVRLLLRFSNKHFLNDPNDVIREISQQLAKQRAHHKNEENIIRQRVLREKELKDARAELEAEREEIKAREQSLSTTADNQEQRDRAFRILEQQVEGKQEEITRLSNGLALIQKEAKAEAKAIFTSQLDKAERRAETLKKDNTTMNKFFIFIAVIAVAALAIIAVLGVGPASLKEANTRPDSKNWQATNQIGTKVNCQKIESNQAARCIGQTVEACGTVAQVSENTRGYFINLDKSFPSQSLSIVIWNNRRSDIEERVGNLFSLEGRRVCGIGEVSSYRGRPQIEISSPYNLRVMKL